MTSNGHFSDTQLGVIDASVTRFEAREAHRRRLEAEQLTDLAAALTAAVGSDRGAGADRELAYRSLRFEVATSLHESEHNAERLLATAYLAEQQFPATLEALREGQISLNHVRVITDEGAPLETGNRENDAPRRERYEREALEFAREETPNRLRPIARRLAAAHSEQTLADRHREALRRRRVRIVPLEDGMADLVAHLSAEDAYAIRDRITQLAKRAKSGDPEMPETLTSSAGVNDAFSAGACDADGEAQAQAQAQRSRDEVRADVFRDLLLGRETSDAMQQDRVQAQIQVVIPAHGVAELIGYGPIDTLTASQIAATAATWDRVTVDEAGVVLSVDRYRPTAQMTRFLAARDLHCRAPGCRVPVNRCDDDHTVDAALGGPTATDNLAHLCRGHHTLKHHTDWSVVQLADGVVKWTSPRGKEHFDKPPSRVRFRRTKTSRAQSSYRP